MTESTHFPRPFSDVLPLAQIGQTASDQSFLIRIRPTASDESTRRTKSETPPRISDQSSTEPVACSFPVRRSPQGVGGSKRATTENSSVVQEVVACSTKRVYLTSSTSDAVLLQNDWFTTAALELPYGRGWGGNACHEISRKSKNHRSLPLPNLPPLAQRLYQIQSAMGFSFSKRPPVADTHNVGASLVKDHELVESLKTAPHHLTKDSTDSVCQIYWSPPQTFSIFHSHFSIIQMSTRSHSPLSIVNFQFSAPAELHLKKMGFSCN